MKLSAYEEYKDSGVDWLGDIPAGWEMKRLKYAAPLINNRAEYIGLDIPYIGLENIEPWTGRYLPNEEPSAEGQVNLFHEGDVLLGKLRPYLAKVHLAYFSGAASTEALVIRSGKELHPAFLRYFTVAPDSIDNINSSTFGSKMPRASWDFIGNRIQLIPPLPEQKAIADFLDEKTGEIDELIGKKRRLLALLAEKRAALITSAVTKGLDPTAKLKPSGINWLGDIPEKWDVRKLKFLIVKLGSGVSVNAQNEPVSEGEIGVLKTSCVYSREFVPSENKKVLEEDIDRVACPVRKGELIISRMNTPDLVGAAGYIDEDHPNLFLPDRLWQTRFFQNSDLQPKFAYMFMTSNIWKSLMKILATGTSGSMKNISHGDFFNISIPLPAKKEQLEIIDWFDEYNRNEKKMVSQIDSAITLLQEYRAALITAAVTGKIKVA